MKKLLYIFLILGLHLSALAGNADKEKSREKLVAGKVVNAFGESVAGAKITIPETGEVYYSDFNGNFKFSLKTDKEYSVSINTIGYLPLELKSGELTAFSDLSLTSL